jgi:hypothetical protein
MIPFLLQGKFKTTPIINNSFTFQVFLWCINYLHTLFLGL